MVGRPTYLILTQNSSYHVFSNIDAVVWLRSIWFSKKFNYYQLRNKQGFKSFEWPLNNIVVYSNYNDDDDEKYNKYSRIILDDRTFYSEQKRFNPSYKYILIIFILFK